MADTPETIESETLITELEMLDPFGDKSAVTRYDKELARWIVLCGEGKCGKTTTMVEIAKRLRALYFDVDPLLGTTAYKGPFVRCNSWTEFTLALEKYKKLVRFQPVKPQVVIVDVLDGLSDYCREHVIKMLKSDDLKNVEIKQADGTTGNGFTLIHSMMKNAIGDLLTLAPVLITVCHPKLSKMGKDENAKSMKSINLIGSFKSYVEKSASCVRWFNRKTNARGKSILYISDSPEDEFSIGDGFGTRPFQGLRDADTAEKFIQWVADTYK